jgi:biopolymer transport protein ExbD
MVARRIGLSCFLLLLTRCGRGGNEVSIREETASASGAASAPPPGMPPDKDARHALLACGAALAENVRESGKVDVDALLHDMPDDCRTGGVTRDDIAALFSGPLALDLPSGSAASSSSAGSGAALPNSDITIDITKECSVLISGGARFDLGPTAGKDVETKLLARFKHDATPHARARVDADSNATHGCVIHVVDLLKQSGVSKIAFGVTPTRP